MSRLATRIVAIVALALALTSSGVAAASFSSGSTSIEAGTCCKN